MFDYLKKYNELPKELRDKINNPAVVSDIEKIERKYGITLAALVMKVMAKEIAITGLPGYFAKEKGFDAAKAENIVSELKGKVFAGVAGYLDIAAQARSAIGVSERKPSSAMGSGAAKPSSVIGSGAAKPGLKNNGDEKHVVKYESHMPVGKAVPRKEAIADPEKAIQDAAKTRVSSFFFSPEDEEEVRELAKNIALVENTPPASGIGVEDKVSRIMAEARINFGSSFLVDRFRQILRTYVKGIRDAIDTKAALKKPFDSGGLSFDEESASKVVTLAEKFIFGSAGKAPSQPKKMILPEDIAVLGEKTGNPESIGIRDVEYDFSALAGKNKAQKPQPAGNASADNLPYADPSARSVETPAKAGIKEDKAFPAKAAKDRERKEEPKTVPGKNDVRLPEEREQALKITVRAPSESAGKVKMEDIKYVPMPASAEGSGAARPSSAGRPEVMTPIDELMFLDLTAFRRMGQQDPYKSAGKIKEKIRLLEDENYGKRIEGIKAWRASRVNKLYLEIGEKSISGNKPVDVIMAERKVKGEDYLSSEEFEAIMDLNKELRF